MVQEYKGRRERMLKIYDPHKDRLVYYKRKADSDFWSSHWDQCYGKNLYNTIRQAKNRALVKLTRAVLPDRQGKILEGGCGIGSNVFVLQKEGYDTYGVDYAEEIVTTVNKLFPELKISVGDVRNLDFPDGYFLLYYSFGVIEHFHDGYEEIVREATRILQPGGRFVVSFPQISLLRRFKVRLGKYQIGHDVPTEDFFQFAFNPREVVMEIEKFGLTLIARKSRGGLKGLKDEISPLRPILQKVYNSKRRPLVVASYLFNLVLSPICGHMGLLIFEKK